MAAEIREATGLETKLVKGSRGIFDVKRDGELIFSKYQSGRFPAKGEIRGLLDAKKT